jgi:hypothetical protein
VLRRGKELPPLSPHPFLRLRRCSSAALRILSLDEAEHFLHNRNASVATLRNLFAFGPECRSRSLRNQRSLSPESSPELGLGINFVLADRDMERLGIGTTSNLRLDFIPPEVPGFPTEDDAK